VLFAQRCDRAVDTGLDLLFNLFQLQEKPVH
jgi:hypothetical protein